MSRDSQQLLSFCWFLSSASSSTTLSVIGQREVVKNMSFERYWKELKRKTDREKKEKRVFYQSLPNMLRHIMRVKWIGQFWIHDHNLSTICSLTWEGSKSYKMPKGREAPPKPEELIEKLSGRLDVVKPDPNNPHKFSHKNRIFCILPHPRGLHF